MNETIPFRFLDKSNWPQSLGRYDINSNKIKDMIVKLDKGGWEIGLHGSIASYNNLDLLQKEKETLENIIGKKIIGTRQHWLNLQIPQTWNIHREIGLKYDSSFGLKYDVGFKQNIFRPFRPFNDNFLVFPIAIMDTFLFGMNLSYEDKVKKVIETIEIAHENNALLTILWHQCSFCETDFKHFKNIYELIIRECKKRKAWFGTGKEIYGHLESYM